LNKNIEHYFFHKENFLDEKYCENSINELNENTWEKHDWYGYGLTSTPAGDNEPEVYHSHSFSENIKEINDFIIQNLSLAISEYVKSFNFDWFGGMLHGADMKFLRYFPGQTMLNHCDHITIFSEDKRRGIPILSIIGILNDDYEGGELIMFEDKKIDTKKGDLLIFPSNFLFPHKITPVTKGVRYSYVSWMW